MKIILSVQRSRRKNGTVLPMTFLYYLNCMLWTRITHARSLKPYKQLGSGRGSNDQPLNCLRKDAKQISRNPHWVASGLNILRKLHILESYWIKAYVGFTTSKGPRKKHKSMLVMPRFCREHLGFKTQNDPLDLFDNNKKKCLLIPQCYNRSKQFKRLYKVYSVITGTLRACLTAAHRGAAEFDSLIFKEAISFQFSSGYPCYP